MAVEQGQLKKLAYKKQAGLGSAASGASGQYLRRETAAFNLMKDKFNSNEIVTHQQYTGDTYGVSKASGTLSGVISPATYKDFLASLVRADFATVTAITSMSLTIAGSGPYTITRAAGDFLTGGIKIGHVVRITAGTYTGTARDINLLVTGVTATVLTVVVPNGSTLTAQGPIASSTVTVTGKTTKVPTTGHTNDYYTLEEWYSTNSKSRLYTDMQVASAAISIPATGNSTISLPFVGLGRTKGGSQVLTSPTTETTSTILSAANAYILVNGTRTTVATSMSLTIDGKVTHGEPVIGSRTLSDVVRGEVMVSGTVTVQYDAETISDLFVNETAVSIICVMFADGTATSEFISFVIPRAKFFGDDIDDGKKQLVMTLPFTAELNSSGGAALANDQTTIGIQDSAA
jgi:hypothetical protein